MPTPDNPKIYHIVHVNKLASIATDGFLFSDAEMLQRSANGTVIGMNSIKERRLQIPLPGYPDLNVGQCVPFYFCPRSVMLYMMHKRNQELSYTGGQEPIIHLVADLRATAAWAQANNQRWAITLSNAGSFYFEDRIDLTGINDLNWDGINAKYWSDNREAKQSEFLIEQSFPWSLVEHIAVHNKQIFQLATQAISGVSHRPSIQIERTWYYD